MESLNHRFPNRLISKRGEHECSPHSTDLKRPDFYLRGFLKDIVYENNPQSITELKVAIPKKVCIRVIDNFARRIQVCHQRNGSQLEYVL